jgi:hypothetical protein
VTNTERQIYKRLEDHFTYPFKVQLWLNTPNPLVGGIKPNDMIANGRENRLLQFIDAMLAENIRP